MATGTAHSTIATVTSINRSLERDEVVPAHLIGAIKTGLIQDHTGIKQCEQAKTSIECFGKTLTQRNKYLREYDRLKKLEADHDHLKLGQMLFEIDRIIYNIVLCQVPPYCDPKTQKKCTTIKDLECLLKTGDYQDAKRKWEELKAKIQWKNPDANDIQELKKHRLKIAHPTKNRSPDNMKTVLEKMKRNKSFPIEDETKFKNFLLIYERLWSEVKNNP